MNRKSISILLLFVVCFLLITGCSAQPQQVESSAGSTQEETYEEAATSVLPADAKIGIADTGEEGYFTTSFISKLSSYLISAGIPEDKIERRTGSGDELAANAAELIGSGCNVIIVGNADETTAPAVTDTAVKAEIPLLYFGTSPGEKEIARWEKEGWRVCYIGSTFNEAAAKRADLFDAAGTENIDLNEDERIGVVILDSGEEKAGDIVNRDSISILAERGYDINVLTESEDEPGEDAETSDAEETADTDETDAEEEDTGAEEAEEEDSGDVLREEAKEQVIGWMDEYGKELEVILCCDDTRALGAMDAVAEEKRKVGHDVMILGFDCNTDSLREVAAGNIRETFFNDFLGQAGNASEAVLAFLRGDCIEPVVISEFVNVTVDNAQEILDISLKAQESTQTQEDGEEETE